MKESKKQAKESKLMEKIAKGKDSSKVKTEEPADSQGEDVKKVD